MFTFVGNEQNYLGLPSELLIKETGIYAIKYIGKAGSI
jgi:hypothetical protein